MPVLTLLTSHTVREQPQNQESCLCTCRRRRLNQGVYMLTWTACMDSKHLPRRFQPCCCPGDVCHHMYVRTYSRSKVQGTVEEAWPTSQYCDRRNKVVCLDAENVSCMPCNCIAILYFIHILNILLLYYYNTTTLYNLIIMILSH